MGRIVSSSVKHPCWGGRGPLLIVRECLFANTSVSVITFSINIVGDTPCRGEEEPTNGNSNDSSNASEMNFNQATSELSIKILLLNTISFSQLLCQIIVTQLKFSISYPLKTHLLTCVTYCIRLYAKKATYSGRHTVLFK